MYRTKRTPDIFEMKASFSGMYPTRDRSALPLARASIPSTRALPLDGEGKPKRVLMSVDLPAPLGPSSPMARLFKTPVRP